MTTLTEENEAHAAETLQGRVRFIRSQTGSLMQTILETVPDGPNRAKAIRCLFETIDLCEQACVDQVRRVI